MNKQETTLEEAAYKIDKYLLGQVKEPGFCYNVFSFKEGAKWQMERSYSEEEVKEILGGYADWSINGDCTYYEWFETNKKQIR